MSYRAAPASHARSFLSMLVMFLCGCSPKADFNSARNACVLFHQRVDSGEYGLVYDDAADGFRVSQDRKLLAGFLGRVAHKLGNCNEATIGIAGVRATLSGTFVMTTATRFCVNGKLDEQFVWLMVGGRAKLARYNANSPLLLTD